MKAAIFITSLFAAGTISKPVDVHEGRDLVGQLEEGGFMLGPAILLPALASLTARQILDTSTTTTSTKKTKTTKSTTSTSSSATASASIASINKKAILAQHNNHRKNATVPSLTWNSNMASIAAQIAASCTFAHNTQAGGGGYGQNIGAGSVPSEVPALITNGMYNGEEPNYPLPYGVEPDFSNFEAWGHYSQIVWKGTTSVGCAVADCSAVGLKDTNGNVYQGIAPYFTVCNYSPPGNYVGQFAANVLPPSVGMPTVWVP